MNRKQSRNGGALVEVEHAAAALSEARKQFARAVIAANRGGVSLREIGRTAGISHVTVRKVIDDADTPEAA